MVKWIFEVFNGIRKKSLEEELSSYKEELTSCKEELTCLKDKYKTLLEIPEMGDLNCILEKFERYKQKAELRDYRFALYFEERFDGPFKNLVTQLRNGLQEDVLALYRNMDTISNKLEEVSNNLIRVIKINNLKS